MSRLKRPLNKEAVKKANAEFYANHPESKGQALSAKDPKQEALRQEWRRLYIKHGGEVEASKSKNKKLGDVIQEHPVTIENIKFMDKDYTKSLDWEKDIIANDERIYCELKANRGGCEKIPEKLKAKIYSFAPNKKFGGSNISGKSITFKKVKKSGNTTIYHIEDQITPKDIGIEIKSGGTYEYAAIGGNSTYNFCNPLEKLRCRGRAIKNGNKNSEIPFANKETFKSAGVEVLRVVPSDDKTKIDRILTKNQADFFYYSGHGSHSSGKLTSWGKMTADVALENWNEDMNILVLGACSVLDILDEDNKGAKPGLKWAKLLKQNGGKLTQLLGYRWKAPLDKQSGKIIAKEFSKKALAKYKENVNPAKLWLKINQKHRQWNACAIDNKGFWYLDVTRMFRKAISSDIKGPVKFEMPNKAKKAKKATLPKKF